MNKAKIERLAKGQTAAADGEPMLFNLYAHLVGGSDFLRTQMGPQAVCRAALARAKSALLVWNEYRERGTL